MAEPYQSRPGWIAFVEGECSEAQYANRDYDWFKQIMYRTMYRFHAVNVDDYYHYGYNTFEHEIFRDIEENIHINPAHLRPDDLRPYIIYFYNRQIIIQMTYIPQMYPGQKISIPLHKSSKGEEIQADIMY